MVSIFIHIQTMEVSDFEVMEDILRRSLALLGYGTSTHNPEVFNISLACTGVRVKREGLAWVSSTHGTRMLQDGLVLVHWVLPTSDSPADVSLSQLGSARETSLLKPTSWICTEQSGDPEERRSMESFEMVNCRRRGN